MYRKTAESIVSSVENPPVVVSKGKVTLADHLKLNELPLATTPAGKNFTLKALHPSEHTIKSARVPGGNFPSVCVVSDQIVTIPITNAGAVVQLAQTANPAIPAVMTIQDGGTKAYNFNNAGFGGSVTTNPTYTDVKYFILSVREKFERYRITAQSVTMELIAPSLSDQGTIIAAQYINKPHTSSLAFPSDSGAGWDHMEIAPDAWGYDQLQNASTWLLGTSAYTSKAREGVYQPLKLTSFKWMNADDPAIFYTRSQGASQMLQVATATPIFFPYYSNRVGAYVNTVDVGMKPSSDGVGVIEVSGLAANVAVRVRVRQIVEISGLPGSYYAPMFEAALPPDEVSVKMYKEISGRMADGYPASYNDLGKLRDIIYKIGKKVLPFAEPVLDTVAAIPGPIGLVANAAKGILPVANAAMAKAKAKRKKRKAAAAVTPAVKAVTAGPKKRSSEIGYLNDI